LRRRPIEAILTFRLIGKEIDRHIQDDVNVLSDIRPPEYQESGSTAGVLDPILIRKLQSQPIRRLMRITRSGQHTVERALRGERIHPRTRLKLMKVARTISNYARTRLADAH